LVLNGLFRDDSMTIEFDFKEDSPGASYFTKNNSRLEFAYGTLKFQVGKYKFQLYVEDYASLEIEETE